MGPSLGSMSLGMLWGVYIKRFPSRFFDGLIRGMVQSNGGRTADHGAMPRYRWERSRWIGMSYSLPICSAATSTSGFGGSIGVCIVCVVGSHRSDYMPVAGVM